MKKQISYSWDESLRGWIFFIKIDSDFYEEYPYIEDLVQILKIDEDSLVEVCVLNGAECDGFCLWWEDYREIQNTIKALEPYIIMGELTDD